MRTAASRAGIRMFALWYSHEKKQLGRGVSYADEVGRFCVNK
jgi:hypothetical protein